MIEDAALQHQRCAELVTHILVLNRPIREAAKACGLKTSVARELMGTETYKRLRSDTLTRLGVVEAAWHDMAVTRIRSLTNKAIDVFSDRMDDDSNPLAQLRAAENIADRAGLERQSKSEIKHIVSLDEETVDRITRAMQESDAIDVTETAKSLQDFAYARQRPTTTPLRDEPPNGSHAQRVPGEGQSQHLLHGESDPGVRRPDHRLPRGDVPVDSEPLEAQIGFGPA